MTPDQETLLKDIHQCLIGNELHGQKGVLHRLETCEVKIDVIEKKKADKWDWSKIFKLGIKFGTKAGGM
jgi:hypothetical protein